MMLYFVSDGNSTLWWITFIFHNFPQNNIGNMLQNLQGAFRIKSHLFFKKKIEAYAQIEYTSLQKLHQYQIEFEGTY